MAYTICNTVTSSFSKLLFKYFVGLTWPVLSEVLRTVKANWPVLSKGASVLTAMLVTPVKSAPKVSGGKITLCTEDFVYLATATATRPCAIHSLESAG